MHKRNRNSILSLVIIHLLLLVYPMMNQIGHKHEHEESLFHHEHSDNISFEQAEETCAVCDFKLLNFVPVIPGSHVVFLKTIPVYNSPEQKNATLQTISYFSLRAPPVA